MRIQRILLVLSCLAVSVHADWWDDFSNNLASDLAPILALFGEQVTKQFLSESTSRLDNFIFAMAPLGILTAVVSAIRVCGGSNLRAFIGRAQEGGGVAEAELCSSTSRDVCELYHNGSIVRVFGRPKILEVVYDKNDPSLRADAKEDQPKHFGIFLFEDYIYLPPAKTGWMENGRRIDLDSRKNSVSDFAPNPNLSLNIGIKKHTKGTWTAAVIGLALQLWIIAFAALVTYYWRWKKNNHYTQNWAFGLMVAGTVTQCVGMYCCAALIETSTKERIFTRRNDPGQGGGPLLHIVQPGNQVVGDQTFDSFSFATPSHHPLEEYTTSWKDPKKSTGSLKEDLIVCAKVATTLVGFILQFIGLRFMHSLVSIMQLAVIVAMSLIRSMLRTQRLRREENLLRGRRDEVVGFELDWLAMQIGRGGDDDSTHEILWSVVVSPCSTSSKTRDKETVSEKKRTPVSETTETVTSNRPDEVGDSLDSVKEQSDVCLASASAHTGSTSSGTGETVETVDTAGIGPLKAGKLWNKHICPTMLFHRRARLAQLTNASGQMKSGLSNDWGDQHVTARPQARQLKRAIEASADVIFQLSTLKGSYKNSKQITWSLSASIKVKEKSPNVNDQANGKTEAVQKTLQTENGQHCDNMESNLLGEVKLSLSRFLVRDNKLSAWKTDLNSLEAVVGLWNWSMISEYFSYVSDGLRPTVPEASALPTERILAIASSEEDLQNAQTNLGLWTEDFPSFVSIKRWNSNPEWHQRSPDIVVDCGDTIFRRDENAKYGPSVRFFGWQANAGMKTEVGSENSATLALCHPVNGSLTTLCAQEVYLSFLFSVLSTVDSIGDVFMARSWTGGLLLRNDFVSKLAECFEESGLGTRQQATLLITSALLSLSKLPFPREALPHLLDTAQLEKKNNQYRDAERSLKWAFQVLQDLKLDEPGTAGRPGLDTVMMELGELYRSRLYHEDDSFASEGITWMRGVLKSRSKHGASDTVSQVICRYSDVADREPSEIAPSAQNIVQAVSFNRREQTLWLLTQQGMDMSSSTRGSWTDVLTHAARQGWTEVVKAVLDLGIKADSADVKGKDVLSHAAENGHIAIVKILLRLKVRTDASDMYGRTAISYAASAGQLAVVAALLEADTAGAHKADREWKSPLFWASLNGRLDVVGFLLEHGAQATVNSGTQNGLNSLVAALMNDYQTTAQLLLDNGANWNIRIDRIHDVCEWAGREGFWEALGFFLDRLYLEQSSVSASSKKSKGTAVVYLMPSEFKNMPVRNRAAEQRGGVVLCQLGPDGTEVEITNDTVASLFDDQCLIQLYTVDWDGAQPKRYDYVNVNGKYRLIKLISRQLGDQFHVHSDVLVTAIQKSKRADEFVQKLLDCRDDEIEITEDIMIATVAVEHERSVTLLELFYKRRGKRLPITTKVLKAVAWNFKYGQQLMELLFWWWGDAIVIEKEVLEAAVVANDLPFLQLLYSRCGEDLPIAELAVKLAVARSGMTVVPLLREMWPQFVSDETDWIRLLRNQVRRDTADAANTKELFEQGLKLYGKSGKDYMPLILRQAVERNNLEVVKLLLTWPGIDVNASVCSSGGSVLFEARDDEMFDVLMEAGGRIDLQNTLGQTALRKKSKLH